MKIIKEYKDFRKPKPIFTPSRISKLKTGDKIFIGGEYNNGYSEYEVISNNKDSIIVISTHVTQNDKHHQETISHFDLDRRGWMYSVGDKNFNEGLKNLKSFESFSK